MCGPVAALLSRRSSVAQSKPALVLLHLGRITSYTLLGLVAGGIGQAVGLGASVFNHVQGVLALLAAHIVIYFAVSLLGWTPSPEKLLAGWIKRWGSAMRKASSSTEQGGLPAAFGFGLLWGLLPCGMVLWAVMTAFTSGNLVMGALNMLVFGAATVLALLAVRWLAGRAFRVTWPRYASAVVLMLFGLQFALRGLSVWGVVNHMMIGDVMLW
jgi:sulfite exporter TauE/SafE